MTTPGYLSDRSATSRRGRLFLLAATMMIALSAVIPTSVKAQSGSSVSVEVIAHDFTVVPDDELRIEIRVRGSIARGSTIAVRASAPLSDREQVSEVLAGTFGSTVDRVTLDVDELDRTRQGDLILRIPTTSGPLRQGVLRLAPPGIHPLRIDIRGPGPVDDPPVLASVTTLAHSADVRGMPDLDVAYVANWSSAPVTDPDGELRWPPESVVELSELASALESSTAPWTLAVTPEALDALERDLELTSLRNSVLDALGDRELIAGPAVSMDPAGAAGSGLVDVYTALLRRGEDLLAALVGRARVTRDISLVTAPINAAGALMMRDLGVQGLVMTPQARRVNAPDTDPRTFDDPTQLVSAPIATDVNLPVGIVDTDLADLLLTDVSLLDTAERIRWELRVVGELMLLRQESLQTLGANDDPSAAERVLARRSVLVSTPDGRTAPSETLASFFERLERTPGLQAVTASEAMAHTDIGIVNGLAATFELPERAGGDLTWLSQRLYEIELDTSTIASMLPPSDPRPRQWEETIWRSAAAELTQDHVTQRLSEVRRDLDEIRDAVASPPVSDVTLGGRRSTIRLKLRNEAAVPLTVTVRLESPKLSFPDGQQLVELPANQVTEVDVAVEVRSNGRFPVSVTLLTPEGDIPLHPPVEFAARANALTGLGQVVTVAGGLVLVSWWVKHLRSRRRSRALDETL